MTKLIYIHVPKCGGSSFGAALRMRFAFSQATIRLGQGDSRLTGNARVFSDYAARRTQLRDLVRRKVRLISGHVQYDPDLHKREARQWAFVTTLRDPVERFVSHYNYLQRAHPDPKRPADLQAFLETQAAPRLASQYLFYFGGQCQTMLTETAVHEARAIAALKQFDLVGNLSDPVGFARDLRALVGSPLPMWRRNRAPEPTRIPCELRPRIEHLCAPDIRIFNAIHSHEKAA